MLLRVPQKPEVSFVIVALYSQPLFLLSTLSDNDEDKFDFQKSAFSFWFSQVDPTSHNCIHVEVSLAGFAMTPTFYFLPPKRIQSTPFQGQKSL